MSSGIFPSFYIAPIAYYAHLVKHDFVLLDVNEHYVKQTYRNRCSILSPNGKLDLIIPLQNRNKRAKMKDVKISYAENWRKVHWKSFCSAYRCSPYFEYYEDEFEPIFLKEKFEYLLDLNNALHNKIISLLDISAEQSETKSYEKEYDNVADYRTIISKKKQDSGLNFKEYIQVFGDKTGYMPNLCILDLLFNEGPNSITYLKGCSL